MSKHRTPQEREFHEAVREIGCLINNADCGGGLQLHHITSGGRRISQYHVLPLCKYHHHWDSPLKMGDAFGKGSKPWERKHGKQLDLLQEVWRLVGYEPSEEEKGCE